MSAGFGRLWTEEPLAHAHWREALPLPGAELLQVLQNLRRPPEAHEDSHRYDFSPHVISRVSGHGLASTESQCEGVS